MAHEDAGQLGKLAQKIEAVAADLNHLKKDGKNSFSNYEYISASQLDLELRSLFQKHKLSIFPELKQYTEHVGLSDKGKEMIRTVVCMGFQIIDHDTGFTLEKQFFGMEQDTGGKSMQQAITQCVKYFYFKLFRVSDSKDVDPDHKTTEAASPRRAVTTPPASPPTAKKSTAKPAPAPSKDQLEEIENLFRELKVSEESKLSYREILKTAAVAESVLTKLRGAFQKQLAEMKAKASAAPAEDSEEPVVTPKEPTPAETVADEPDEVSEIQQLMLEVKALIFPDPQKTARVQLNERFAQYCGKGITSDNATLLHWRVVHKVLKDRIKAQEKEVEAPATIEDDVKEIVGTE